MRRLSFDLACTARRPYTDPFLDTFDEAVRYWTDKHSDSPIVFHAATVIDEETGEVLNHVAASALADCLSGAVELVTFNGTVYDLPVLAAILGTENSRGMLGKPHHDLQRLQSRFDLRSAVRDAIRGSDAEWNEPFVKRSEELAGSAYTDFQKNHLAGTYRDSLFTLRLFQPLQGMRAHGG